MKRYTKEVFLTYDSDGAGVKAALRAIPILKEVGITTKIINMRPYKDPDEFMKALGAEAYQERIDNAENSFMFEIRIMEEKYDMNDPESKTHFYNEIASKLLGFSEELERNNYIQAVADKYHIAFEDLRKLVNNLADSDFETIDVTIRCYLLSQALDEVLDDGDFLKKVGLDKAFGFIGDYE